MKRALYLLAGGLGALIPSTPAAGAASETGVTSSQVLIGGTTPLSGNASAYQSVAKGAAAYFRWVNAHGGVNKRKIKYIYKDDGYDPSKTADKTRDHVRQGLQAVPVDDGLPAELPRRGDDLRPLRRQDEPEGPHRRPLPERRLRQGPARP